MKNYLILIILSSLTLLGCSEQEQASKPVQEVKQNKHPRLSEPDPRAWEGLPMEVVISDFQKSDGIFSSFICDELNKRLSENPSDSLSELNQIDKKTRMHAFKICLSPEGEDPSSVLKAIRNHSGEYPELVKEITGATK